jgi:Flp pilus assembly protein TadG
VSARRGIGALARDSRGATAVEFACVLPVFIAMVMGIFQFGWTQHCASSLRAALEQASRALMLNPSLSESTLRSMVQAKLQNGADPNVAVSLAIDPVNNGARIARLTGVYQRSLGVPLLMSFPVDYRTTVVTALPPP